jgi:hypothetical protein
MPGTGNKALDGTKHTPPLTQSTTMSEIGEIVYRAEMANGNIVCQFTKTAEGYLREQILSSGMTMEQDYSEEEYQEFLEQMTRFNRLAAKGKREDSEKQAAKRARKK